MEGIEILFFLHICALYSISTARPTERSARAVFMPSEMPPEPWRCMSSRMVMSESFSGLRRERKGERRVEAGVSVWVCAVERTKTYE